MVGGPLLRHVEEPAGFLVNRHLMPMLLNLGGLGKGFSGFAGAAGPAPRGGAEGVEKPGAKPRPKRGNPRKPRPAAKGGKA